MHDTQILGGIKTTVVSRNELASQMLADCRNSSPGARPKLVFSSNGQGVDLYNKDRRFQQLMDTADIVHADGMSVVYASRLFYKGRGLAERVATTDFFHDAARAAVDNGLRFYMLGATKERVGKAVARVREMYPELKISGYRDGYFSEDDLPSIAESIVASRADVVWVGVGRPLQESVSHWLAQRLTDVGWIKTCGGLFDFLSGESSRAPSWMQQYGLEWLFRMMKEPRRLGTRYITTNIRATYYLLTRSG